MFDNNFVPRDNGQWHLLKQTDGLLVVFYEKGEARMFAVQFILFLTATNIINMFALALAGNIFNLRILGLGIGIGPAIFEEERFSLKLLFMLGSSVEFDNFDEELNEFDEDSGEIPVEQYDEFNEGIEEVDWVSDDADFSMLSSIPLYAQSIVIFSGVISMLMLGLVLFEGDFISSFVSTFSQTFKGALSPLGDAQELLQEYRDVMDKSIISAFGLLCIKIGAYNLIPFMGMSTFSFLNLANHKYRIIKQSVITILSMVLLLPLLLGVYVSWIFAFIANLF